MREGLVIGRTIRPGRFASVRQKTAFDTRTGFRLENTLPTMLPKGWRETSTYGRLPDHETLKGSPETLCGASFRMSPQ